MRTRLRPALLVLSILALACGGDTPPQGPPAPAPEPTTPPLMVDPFGGLGHGQFFDAEGRPVEVTPARAAAAQAFYVATLERSLGGRAEEGRALRAKLNELVDDTPLATALYLDWLLERSERPDAHISMMHHALRWWHVWRSDHPNLPDRRGRWAKGLDDRTAEKVESELGMTVFALTRSGGEDYIRECREAGVPVPERVASSAWSKLGSFDGKEFISTSRDPELWLWESTSPAGGCLALPRYVQGTDNIALYGVICVGLRSSKACVV